MLEMTIGQLAAAAVVNVETVRYYQRRGLLPTPLRPSGGIRRYTSQALSRVQFIKRAQALGFSLDEVKSLLSLHDGRACSTARKLGELKLADVRQRIGDLQALEAALASLVRKCATTTRTVSCPLIEALATGGSVEPPIAKAQR